MSIAKHNESLDYLFTNILKRPMMSKYCDRTECHPKHLGICRYLCYNCNGIKYITIPPRYEIVYADRTIDDITTFRAHECTARGIECKVRSTSENLETVRKGLHTWHELDFEPKCDSCKYVEKWKKENWGKYVGKAIGWGTKERKELRKIFCKKDERLAIRKLLTFFNCNTTISMRDSLTGVIDYMYPV